MLRLIAEDSTECYGAFDFTTSVAIILVSCVLGIAWAVFNFIQVKKVDVLGNSGTSRDELVEKVTEKQRKLIVELGDKIANVQLV